MTQDEMILLYRGDVIRVEVPGWILIEEASVIRFEDYNNDGIPDKVFVYGKRTGGAEVALPVYPAHITNFINHDPKVQALLDSQNNTDKDAQIVELQKKLQKCLKRNESLESAIDGVVDDVSDAVVAVKMVRMN